ncbi:hypothetical protein ACC861_37615 [Rhizobium ruizarguesonis]
MLGEEEEGKKELGRIDAMASHVRKSDKNWQRSLAAECGSER